MAEPKSLEEVRGIVERCQHLDWRFLVHTCGAGYLLQVCFRANVEEHGAPTTIDTVRGRKWYVSSFTTDSEIVQTALKAVLTALEHEARENFLFDGRAVFGPHYRVERLHELASDAYALDIRPPRDTERRRAT